MVTDTAYLQGRFKIHPHGSHPLINECLINHSTEDDWFIDCARDDPLSGRPLVIGQQFFDEVATELGYIRPNNEAAVEVTTLRVENLALRNSLSKWQAVIDALFSVGFTLDPDSSLDTRNISDLLQRVSESERRPDGESPRRATKGIRPPPSLKQGANKSGDESRPDDVQPTNGGDKPASD